MKSLLTLLVSAILALVPGHSTAPAQFGAAVPSTPALIDTYLAANITATQTSMVLANGNTRAGTALTGTICFVIDVNTPTVEYVCGTASSTNVTGLSRGIDVLNPNTTSSLLAYTHRRFASVQVSDYPTLQFLVRKMNGTDTLDSPLSYTSTSSALITLPGQLASKAYTDSLSIAGGVVADNTTPGISRIATSSQLATGAANSGGYAYVAPSTAFNSTSSATNLVPVTNSSGKLSQGFLDLTQPFTFSGGVTSTGVLVQTATTTFSVTPTAPTSTLSTQLANKGYVDSKTKTVTLSSVPLRINDSGGYVELATSSNFGASGSNDIYQIKIFFETAGGTVNWALFANNTLLGGASTTVSSNRNVQVDLIAKMANSSTTESVSGLLFDSTGPAISNLRGQGTQSINMSTTTVFTLKTKAASTDTNTLLYNFSIIRITPDLTF